MSAEGRALEAARTPHGGRRFYPTGRHPSQHRYREHLRRLEEVRNAGAITADVAEAIVYCRRKLAEFEHGECLAKTHYLRRLGL